MKRGTQQIPPKQLIRQSNAIWEKQHTEEASHQDTEKFCSDAQFTVSGELWTWDICSEDGFIGTGYINHIF
jgi:hypothetical protein